MNEILDDIMEKVSEMEGDVGKLSKDFESYVKPETGYTDEQQRLHDLLGDVGKKLRLIHETLIRIHPEFLKGN